MKQFLLLVFLFPFFNTDNLIPNCPSSNNMNVSKYEQTNNKQREIISNKNKDIDSERYAGVPVWYLENRVEVHTRLGLNNLNNPAFFDFPVELSKYNATVLTRQIKFADEEPWWPSKIGKQNPLTLSYNTQNSNLAKKIIDQLHSLNIKAIIYYRHTEDSEMLAEHPDWVCADVNGRPVKSARGYALSLNSPYREVLITRIRELASYGADGFCFDYIHIPKNGDFSKYSQHLYRQEYKSDLTTDFRSGKVLNFFAFRNQTIKNFFEDLKDSLAKDGRNPVLLISGNDWPTLTDLHMNSEIYKDLTLKSELEIPQRVIKTAQFKTPPDVQKNFSVFDLNAFLFSFMRDNSQGPPYIWCPQIQTAEDAANIAAGLISLGCIADLDIDPFRSDMNNFKVPLQWNIKYGDIFKSLVPYAFNGIVVSEDQRNQFVNSPADAWKQVLMPAFKSFKTIYDAGIPVRLISDAHLNDNSINKLKTVYCNQSLTKSNATGKFQDFSQLNFNASPKELAIKLSSPVFAIKQTQQTHINYFTDKSGYLYIIKANDFGSSAKKFKTAIITGNTSFKLYVSKTNTVTPKLEMITTKNTIDPSTEEAGYYVFNISDDSSLGIYRIKFKTN